jgi:hypothetical protein
MDGHSQRKSSKFHEKFIDFLLSGTMDKHWPSNWDQMDKYARRKWNKENPQQSPAPTPPQPEPKKRDEQKLARAEKHRNQ